MSTIDIIYILSLDIAFLIILPAIALVSYKARKNIPLYCSRCLEDIITPNELLQIKKKHPAMMRYYVRCNSCLKLYEFDMTKKKPVLLNNIDFKDYHKNH
jgi:hypothetical protein